MTNDKINKEKWADLLKTKTPLTHAKIMQQMGISPEEDHKWHEENGGEPADWSKLEK